MSYDFTLFRPPQGVDPITAYRNYIQERKRNASKRVSFRDKLGPIDAGKEQTKRHLAECLLARHPTLQIFRWNYKKLAEQKSMEEYEVRRRYRELELTDSHSGLQIILFDETAALTIPFGKHLEKTLSFAWDCLNVLEVEGHFAVYDSQVGKILNLKADFDVVKKALTE